MRAQLQDRRDTRPHKKAPSLAEEEIDALMSAQADDDAVRKRLARVHRAR